MPRLEEFAKAATGSSTAVYGITRAFAAHALAHMARVHPERHFVVVTPDEASARELVEDIDFFAPGAAARAGGDQEAGAASAPADDPAAPRMATRVPSLDVSPYAEVRPDQGALMGRMAALYRLARGGALMGRVTVLSALSLLRRVVPPEELGALSFELEEEAERDRDELAEALVRAGYTRTTVVEDPGSFAVRGGVVDLFVPLYRFPVRLEFFGDTIEALRFFDPDSQRTLRATSLVRVHPVRETVLTRGASVRARILAAADAARTPSRQSRALIERVESGQEFIGMEALAPAFHEALVPIWRYLEDPGRAITWFFLDPDGVAQEMGDELEVAEAQYQARIDDHKPAFEPGEHYVTRDEMRDFSAGLAPRIEARTIEVVGRPRVLDEDGPEGEDRGEGRGRGVLARLDTDASLRFAVDDHRALAAELERTRRVDASELMKPLISAIRTWQEDEWQLVIAAGSLARARQLATLLADYECASEVREAPAPPFEDVTPGGAPVIRVGRVSAGFALATDRRALVSADDIFGQRRRTSARQRAAAKRARKALMGGSADFSQLQPGDYLVHELHGIGRYLGLAKLSATPGGPEIDFLHLEYVGGTLYVPVYRLAEVNRYVGADGHAPTLDKLGGTSWQKAKKKAAQNVAQLAEQLLQIYAQRAALPGHGYPPADAMFREFEATFPFEETPDQERVIGEVMADMEKPEPMDRLVCGDVGYGKTEVAMRAMFKAIMGGKQAAFLAPTTVLVEQHFRTARERFAGWPVEVARLSRFQSTAERTATLTGLVNGTVDLVVGTHRLLSKDVRFKELGLLVIDEEQRFGVSHKEKLRRVRTQMDVLTLSATPIPRTLHLAMTGLRDLSIIATPPADRRAVRTFVMHEDDAVLRQAIRRELARGGQVFFVCPRVSGTRPASTARSRATDGRSVGEWADHLAELVPEAKVGTAHGQMSARDLEKAMVGFVGGGFDILVATTIIENGLDIPRANTMFIDRADMFGLSQLYQLRGRIGRSKERAFCYLVVPQVDQLSPDARRRMEALQRFTELGAGFQIASHDLEIRGGGELLGAKQSGAIAAVGFETYVAMLEQAVSKLRGEDYVGGGRARRPVELDVDIPGYIPDEYIPDPGQRLGLYKRLSDAESEDEIRDMMVEIEDRYGAPPEEVRNLGELMTLACLARGLGAERLELSQRRLVLALGQGSGLSAERVAALAMDGAYRLTPDMRLVYTFTSDEARRSLASARDRLLDLAAYAT